MLVAVIVNDTDHELIGASMTDHLCRVGVSCWKIEEKGRLTH